LLRNRLRAEVDPRQGVASRQVHDHGNDPDERPGAQRREALGNGAGARGIADTVATP
jgi:hypothetical protein